MRLPERARLSERQLLVMGLLVVLIGAIVWSAARQGSLWWALGGAIPYVAGAFVVYAILRLAFLGGR
jgi:predicted membrane channel-forming protein YqfA (hemolysin III family)